MTEAEWIAQVQKHAPELRELIETYHPSNIGPWTPKLEITAPAAEAACHRIRREIGKEGQRPGEEFDEALETHDIGALMSLLDATWFGVPESTGCWRIPGFKEAVDLMDDPPEMDEAQGEANDAA